jgi:ABC-type cobalamin/Fe3+-siderophores transport system ATPase subunit
MIQVSDVMAPVLVAALRDAMKYNEALAQSRTVADPTDIEEFLVSLGHLEMEIKRQYEKLQGGNRQMVPYEQIWTQVAE